jgi:hypothetical protein
MRLALSFLTLLCLSCADEDGASKRGEVDSGQSGNASAVRASEPGRLDVEWAEPLPLPDDDLLECEVTSNQPDWTGQSPHTFRVSYDAATRTLKDPRFDTVFDANGRPVQLYIRSNPRASASMLVSTTAFDEHGQPLTVAFDSNKTIEFENEYDQQGRVTSIVTSSPSQPSQRDEYHYEDELNPTLWSRYERHVDGTLAYWFERAVEIERQTFTRMNRGGVEGRWLHTYAHRRLVSLVQYGGGFLGEIDIHTARPNGQATWEWDDDETLLSYQSSGTWGSDLGSGTEQFSESYSTGCRELVRHFPWQFHLPGRDDWTRP